VGRRRPTHIPDGIQGLFQMKRPVIQTLVQKKPRLTDATSVRMQCICHSVYTYITLYIHVDMYAYVTVYIHTSHCIYHSVYTYITLYIH